MITTVKTIPAKAPLLKVIVVPWEEVDPSVETSSTALEGQPPSRQQAPLIITLRGVLHSKLGEQVCFPQPEFHVQETIVELPAQEILTALLLTVLPDVSPVVVTSTQYRLTGSTSLQPDVAGGGLGVVGGGVVGGGVVGGGVVGGGVVGGGVVGGGVVGDPDCTKDLALYKSPLRVRVAIAIQHPA
jgi:hypothetical protein